MSTDDRGLADDARVEAPRAVTAWKWGMRTRAPS